jgi:probable HAF family extracellular repeat protein
MHIQKEFLSFRHVALGLALLSGGLHIQAQAAAPTVRYAITELSLLAGYKGNDAYAINNAGQVAGSSWREDGGVRATLWDVNGAASAIDRGWPWAYGYALNNAGVVVGTAYAGDQYPTQWSGGQETTLSANTCCGASGSATGINDQGTVVGWVDYRAVTWSSTGSATLLPNLLRRGGSSSASAINNAGQVTGYSSAAGGALHAVVWNGAAVLDLGLLSGFSDSVGSSINEAGLVVGLSSKNSFNTGHATLWRNGQVIDLGSLRGGLDSSQAYDVNNLGQIVGISGNNDLTEPPGDDDEAVIWLDDESGPVALSSLIDDADPLKSVAKLYRAVSINDSGIIVGYGLINGEKRAYILTPLASVPEASAVVSALGGVTVLGLMSAWRRRRI